MAWTATVSHKEFSEGKVRVIVDYTDGTNKAQENYYIDGTDPLEFKKRVLAKIAQLEKAVTFSDSLSNGAVDLTPIVVDPPSKEDADKKTWLANYAKWKSLKIAEENGFIPTDSKDTLDVYAILKSTYKLEYGVF